MFNTFKFTVLIGSALLFAASAAQATSVPAGTLSFSADYSPVVSTTANTVELDDGSPDFDNGFIFNGGTGYFLHASTSHTPKSAEGSTNGVINFSPMVGGVVSYATSPLDELLSFTDVSTGETYDFDLDQSVSTLSDATTGTGSTIGLYILGDLTATGTNTYSTLTPTALTISLTQTGVSSWSLSGTLSNPPPGYNVPEPASLALLGGGLISLALARRRKLL